jgi:hypothetical protein
MPLPIHHSFGKDAGKGGRTGRNHCDRIPENEEIVFASMNEVVK